VCHSALQCVAVTVHCNVLQYAAVCGAPLWLALSRVDSNGCAYVCVEVSCRVRVCVAGCSSVLQVCDRVLQCVAVFGALLWLALSRLDPNGYVYVCVEVRCRMLQCVVGCCSVLQCVAVYVPPLWWC